MAVFVAHSQDDGLSAGRCVEREQPPQRTSEIWNYWPLSTAHEDPLWWDTHRERLLVMTEYLAPPSGESTQSFRNAYRRCQQEVIQNCAGQNTCVHPAQVNESQSVSVCMCCLTWKAFRRQLSEWPEDVTHEGRTAGAGLCYRRKNLMYISLKILLSTHKHMHMRCRKILCSLGDKCY